MNVKPDDLGRAIAEALTQYSDEVEEAIEKEKLKVAREGAKTLRQTSPKRTGRYAKGWATKKLPDGAVVVYNKRYQITHLLEKGHVKRGGGRVRAIPHIRPVEQQMIKEYEARVKAAIKNG